MSIDKAVDSTQLDADLTSVANAIRTKGGTSAQLAFPAGFVQAIGDIETGGDASQYISVIEAQPQNGIITLSGVTKLQLHLFQEVTGAYSVESDEIIKIGNYCFDGSTGLIGLYVKNCTEIGTYALRGTHINSFFAPLSNLLANAVNSNTYIQTAIFGKTTSGNFQFRNDTALKVADVCGDTGRFDNTFRGCTNFDTLIIRKVSNPYSLSGINTFSTTKFDSSGTGGTLYVPQALIADYQAATNWSTILGYETNQILPIEGSIYETQYADGTPITT